MRATVAAYFATVLFRYRALVIALAWRRPSPTRVPLSGKAVFKRKYNSVSLGDKVDPERVSISEVTRDGYVGWYFPPNGDERVEICVPTFMLSYWDVQIRQYNGPIELRYLSATKFLFANLMGLPFFSRTSEWLLQVFYNRRKLVRADRVGILRIIVERTIQDAAFRVSPVQIMTMKYGVRWVHHPDNQNLRNYYSFLLGSLAGSGALREEIGSFALLPKALADLEVVELEERHHGDMIKQQALLAVLTTALVFIGVLQVTPIVAKWFGYADAPVRMTIVPANGETSSPQAAPD